MEDRRKWSLILRLPISDSDIRIMVSDHRRYIFDATVKKAAANTLVSEICNRELTPQEVMELLNGNDAA